MQKCDLILEILKEHRKHCTMESTAQAHILRFTPYIIKLDKKFIVLLDNIKMACNEIKNESCDSF